MPTSCGSPYYRTMCHLVGPMRGWVWCSVGGVPTELAVLVIDWPCYRLPFYCAPFGWLLMPVNFNGSRQRQKRYERKENEPLNGTNLAKIKYAFSQSSFGRKGEESITIFQRITFHGFLSLGFPDSYWVLNNKQTSLIPKVTKIPTSYKDYGRNPLQFLYLSFFVEYKDCGHFVSDLSFAAAPFVSVRLNVLRALV